MVPIALRHCRAALRASMKSLSSRAARSSCRDALRPFRSAPTMAGTRSRTSLDSKNGASARFARGDRYRDSDSSHSARNSTLRNPSAGIASSTFSASAVPASPSDFSASRKAPMSRLRGSSRSTSLARAGTASAAIFGETAMALTAFHRVVWSLSARNAWSASSLPRPPTFAMASAAARRSCEESLAASTIVATRVDGGSSSSRVESSRAARARARRRSLPSRCLPGVVGPLPLTWGHSSSFGLGTRKVDNLALVDVSSRQA